MKTNKIYEGSSLEVLKTFPDTFIDCVMTSPPYWALRDYGTGSWEGGDNNCDHLNGTLQSMKTTLNHRTHQNDKRNFTGMPYMNICKKCGAKRVDKQLGLETTFEEYINKLCSIFDEVKRTLKTSGTCWVNLGDTYSGSGKGVGFNGKNKESWNFNKKPNVQDDVPDKCLTMIPQRFAIEMVNRGWILRNTIIWHKKKCMPSSVKDRFTVDFEYLFFFVKNNKYFFETQYEPHKKSSIERTLRGNSETNKWVQGAPSQTPHSINKPRKNIRKEFNDLQRSKGMQEGMKYENPYCKPEGRNKRTVWAINPKPFPDAHFAVYPEELCETPIKSGCPEGGVVLDPFIGSGTTGIVALKQSKKFIGIELNEEYIKMAEKRLKPYLDQKKIGEYM